MSDNLERKNHQSRKEQKEGRNQDLGSNQSNEIRSKERCQR